jgi:hypothetical protein
VNSTPSPRTNKIALSMDFVIGSTLRRDCSADKSALQEEDVVRTNIAGSMMDPAERTLEEQTFLDKIILDSISHLPYCGRLCGSALAPSNLDRTRTRNTGSS